MFLLFQLWASLCPPPLLVKELNENWYVDDFLSGTDTETEATELFTETKKVVSKAGMVLARWKSNLASFVGKTLFDSGAQHVKVLGVTWNSQRDIFTFNRTELAGGSHCRKA